MIGVCNMEKNFNRSEHSEEVREGLEEGLIDSCHYQYALDLSASLVVLDHRGMILHANDQFCQLTQYEKRELSGRSYRTMILNESNSLWATLESGKMWKGETAKYKRNGDIVWMDETIIPFKDKTTDPYYISIQHNITRYKQIEKGYKRCSSVYQLIIESSSDLIAIVNDVGDFTYVSPSFESLGFETSELSNFYDLIEPTSKNRVKKCIQTTCTSQQLSETLEVRLRKENGLYVDMEMTINPISDSVFSNQQNVVIVLRDISDRKRNEQMIEHYAYHDTLTDLPNRRFFMRELRKEVRLADEPHSQLTVMFLDVDRFKYINDFWGHEIGDLILAEAAKRIRKSVRPHDMVARLGGDEFTILLKNTSINEAKALAKNIHDQFLEPIIVHNKDYSISCSIGIALLPDHAKDANELLNRADTALYYVKEHGGGKYAVFHMEMEAKSLERNLLENELMKAIEKEQFSIDYQPKVDFS